MLGQVNKSNDVEGRKLSMIAFGYLSEKGSPGKAGRRKFYLGIIVFMILLILALYLALAHGLTNTQKLFSNPITFTSAVMLGLVVGVIVGLTSVGSGALMAPILLLDFGSIVGKTLVVGTATTAGTVEKFVVSLRNYFKKTLKMSYALMIAYTGVPLAAVGAFYSSVLIKWNLFSPLLSGVLLVVGLVIIVQSKLEKINYTKDPPMTRSLRIRGLLVGVVIGLVAGLTGVSTGSLLVASLILLLKFPNRTAVTIALFEGALILFAATATQLYLGHVNLPFTGALLLGGIPGILIGNHYKDRVGQNILGYGIAIVIIFEAARTLSAFFFGKSFFIFNLALAIKTVP